MMPMVFWASLPPWPRLKAAAETSCSLRKSRSTSLGMEPRKTHNRASISANATARPASGDTKMNSTVRCRLCVLTTLQPALATPAPTKPPISACDEEVGRPSHQVVRFQAIAPTRPANTTASLTTEGSMIVPMVLATWVLKTRKATKLKKAAQIPARRGWTTLVETTVAIELAASWKPLEKSNTTARQTIAMTAAWVASGMLQHDALDRVGHVLQPVQRPLDLVDDVLPHEQVPGGVLGGVGVEAVQLRPGVPVQPVALVSRLLDADPVGAQRLLVQLAKVPDAPGRLRGRLLDQAGLLDHRLDRLGDAVQHQHVRGGLQRVHHVVQVAGE